MPVSTRHRIDKISIGSSFTLGSANSIRSSFNMELLTNYPAGHVAALCIANLGQKPQISVTTPEIDTVLNGVPVNGLSTAVDSYLYQKLANDTGTVARATTSHTRHAMSQVTTYWPSFTLPHNAEGTIELMVHPVWDGTNDIIVPAGTLALSGNLACDPRYGAGPVSINGSAIAGVQSIEVSSGAQIVELGASSEQWPTVVAITRVNPVVRITTTSIQLATMGISGTALNGTTGLVFWGRRLRSADASSHHIKGVGLNGIVHVESESGESAEDYRAVLVVTLSSASDSVMPLIFTTAQAIA